MIHSRMIATILCGLLFLGCTGNEGTKADLKPAMEIISISVGVNSATITTRTVNATNIRVMCVETADASTQTAQSVVANGTKYTGTTIALEGLSPFTEYTVLGVACNDVGQYGILQKESFKTADETSEMYPWEKSRTGLLSFTDLVLCYGGSPHRSPNRWAKGRFEPFVTYVDTEGAEHWLFDGFLMLEFVLANASDGQRYSLMTGVTGTSAGKAQWQELINYWFSAGNGVNALEETVKEASKRLGMPPSKRKMVISMPDPIIYKKFADRNETKIYWGTLDGSILDFGKSQDRIDACKWYINEVRRKFDQGNYQYVDLAGFYLITEELVSPDDGWDYDLKKSDEVVPFVSEYLHTLNESVSWIPYNRSAGYKRWEQFGVDYAYMQPNYFWPPKEGQQPKSMPIFFDDIKTWNLAMEFEFDDAVLEGKPDCVAHRARFREYMNGCKTYGVYGKKILSYYQGDNTMYNLWISTAAQDKELYHEFCRFVIGNPLRK